MKSPFFENETFVSLNAPAKIAASGTTEISSNVSGMVEEFQPDNSNIVLMRTASLYELASKI